MPRRTKENQAKFVEHTINFANILLHGTEYRAEHSRSGGSYFNIRHKDGEIHAACLTAAHLSQEASLLAKTRKVEKPSS